MTNYQSVFERKETKYLITYDQWNKLLIELRPYMELDQYGKHLITNIYYDTPSWYLIRHSMSKPLYKEKVRLRSYGIPTKKIQSMWRSRKNLMGLSIKEEQRCN